MNEALMVDPFITRFNYFLVALPAVLTALALFIQNVRNNGKQIVKLNEIHQQTNSNLEKVTAALERANEKISNLESLISILSKLNNGRVAASQK